MIGEIFCLSCTLVSIPWPRYGMLDRWEATVAEKDPFLRGEQPLTAAIASWAPPLERPRTCLCLLILSVIQHLFIEVLPCVRSYAERQMVLCSFLQKEILMFGLPTVKRWGGSRNWFTWKTLKICSIVLYSSFFHSIMSWAFLHFNSLGLCT